MGQNFGEHLTIDGYNGQEELLNSREVVLECLTKLPGMLGMHVLGDPVIYSAPDNQKKDPGGWSGMVVVAESHISIHTFPARKFVSIDVYTCKTGMDTEMIINYFKEKFGLEEVETNFLKRGTRYPEHNLA